MQPLYMTPSMQHEIEETVKNLVKPAPKSPKRRPTKITYNGQTIVLKNGKHVWNQPGQAKNAIHNAWNYLCPMTYDYGKKQYLLFGKYYSYPEAAILSKELYHWFITKLVKFEDA